MNLSVNSFKKWKEFVMTKVRFGDVVKEVKLNVDRNNNPYDYFIAGDHMDSENLKISRRGHFENSDVGPAFTRIFKPGQILYGSRRTYLKKVAVADFEGITSNTTFVLESKDTSVLSQRLLPFILLSDKFTDFSINNSKGSTNPYILFSDLAKFEFDLPPLEEQEKLAELLWVANDTKEAYKKLYVLTDELIKSRFVDMFGLPDNNVKGFQRGTIRDIVSEVRYGTSKPATVNGKYPYLRMNNITYEGKLDLSNLKYIDIPDNEIEKCVVRKGDVLFNRTNSKELVGKTCVFNMDAPMVIAGYLIRVRLNDKVLPEYLSTYLNLSYSKKNLFEMCKSAIGQANINAQELQNIEIIIPPMSLQLEFLELLKHADKSKFDLQQTILNMDDTIKSLMHRIYV